MKEQQQLNLNGHKKERYNMGLCMGIGLVLGAGIGVAMDNIGAGMGTGFMLGIAIYEYYNDQNGNTCISKPANKSNIYNNNVQTRLFIDKFKYSGVVFID